MTCRIKLVSPIPPSVNHYLGWRAIVKGKRPMAISYETKEAKEYKKEFKKSIVEQLKNQQWDYDETGLKHIYVDTVFYFDKVNKDANNHFKCSLDAITETGLIWKDDNIVCERVNGIYYDYENPRMEMTIYPVDYIGIFKDDDELMIFEDKCRTCNRYNRNCSILRDSKAGKIRKELKNLTCEKYKSTGGK